MTAAPPHEPGDRLPRVSGHPMSMRERRRLRPPRAARVLLTLAVSNLPPQHRHRYTLEFLAELYGQRPTTQITYAGGLLLHSWRLGAALSESEPESDLVKETTMKKNWRCRLGFHRYVRKVNPDAGGPFKAYLECARCQHFHDIGFQIGQ